MYTVEFTEKAAKTLRKLPAEDAATILRKLQAIRQNPLPSLKKLKGTKFWRLRVAKYRAIIDVLVSGQRLIVLKVDKRERVY